MKRQPHAFRYVAVGGRLAGCFVKGGTVRAECRCGTWSGTFERRDEARASYREHVARGDPK